MKNACLTEERKEEDEIAVCEKQMLILVNQIQAQQQGKYDMSKVLQLAGGETDSAVWWVL